MRWRAGTQYESCADLKSGESGATRLAREGNTMEYMKRILKHYIITALHAANSPVDWDTHSELENALEEVVKLESRVAALEQEVAALLNERNG
jgi:uncharacterized protein YceH (UPF0502 family)